MNDNNCQDKALRGTPASASSCGVSFAPVLKHRNYASYCGALLMTLAAVAAGYCALHGTLPGYDGFLGGDEEQDGVPPASPFGNDYRKWERPQLALVLTGQMHGYINPCGCTYPQYGGLVRRYNFIESLRGGFNGKKGWDVVGVDLGDLPQVKGSHNQHFIHNQNLLKYELSMKALALMNYRAAGIGRDEILSPLGEALAQVYEKSSNPRPRPIATTLAKTSPGQLYYDDLNVRPYEITKDTNPKIGIISMMGPDLREQLKKHEEFLKNDVELPKALNAFAAAGVEIGIILHHEYPLVKDEVVGIQRMQQIETQRKKLAGMVAQYCANARKANPKIPPIQLMMILTDEPEPPAMMQPLDPGSPTQIVEIGHKGKYVGLVGLYRTGNTYRLQYQIVLMGPEWETAEGKEGKQPVLALMQKYNDQLKQRNMLNEFTRTPHYNQLQDPNEKGLKATYVGSDTCIGCHEHAGTVWKKGPPNKRMHARATDTLEKLRHPSGQQFDPECIVCHSVGFKHPGGYNDPIDPEFWPKRDPQNPLNPKMVKEHNDLLRGVGCESCHGPGSQHVRKPNNADIRKLINPYAPTDRERFLEQKGALAGQEKSELDQLFSRRMQNLDQFCVKCHDPENDVNWGKPGKGVIEKWKEIVHRKPGPQANNGNPPNGANQGKAPIGVVPPIELQLEAPKIGNLPIPEIRIELEPEKKQ